MKQSQSQNYDIRHHITTFALLIINSNKDVHLMKITVLNVLMITELKSKQSLNRCQDIYKW